VDVSFRLIKKFRFFTDLHVFTFSAIVKGSIKEVILKTQLLQVTQVAQYIDRELSCDSMWSRKVLV